MADNTVMSTETVDGKQRFVFSHITESAGDYAKTLKTAGSFGDKDIRVKITTPEGSATVSSEITANPSIQLNKTTGKITAVVEEEKNVIPTVAPGYITAGTQGSVEVNGRSELQLSTKTAETYIPTTTDQTIPADKYLLGAQTVKGDPNLISENIADGVTLFGVEGSHKGGDGEIGIKAKLGGVGDTVLLNGDYGPMGNASTDYIVPVSRNGAYTLLNTGSDFEIACAFKITQYPEESVAIFGAFGSGTPMPALYLDADGESISYSIPIGSGDAPESYETGEIFGENSEPFPLNAEIYVKMSYDGKDCTISVNYGTDGSVNEIIYDVPVWKAWGTIAYGKNGEDENTLAGLNGSYFNVDRCSIVQSAVIAHQEDLEDGEVLAELGEYSKLVKLSGIYGPTEVDTDDYIKPVDNYGNFATLDTTKPFEIGIVFKITGTIPGVTFFLGAVDTGDSSSIHDLPMLYLGINGSIHYYLFSGDANNPVITRSAFEDVIAKSDAWVKVVVKWDGTNMTLTAGDGESEEDITENDFIPVQTKSALCCFGGGNGKATNLTSLPGSYIDLDNCYIKQGEKLIWGNQPSKEQKANPVIEPLTATENRTYTLPVGVDGFAPVTVDVPTGGIMTGTTPPTSDMGSDGDYYKQIFPLAIGINFVEYLESSGTQYINTQIYATQDIDAVVTGDRRSGNSNGGVMLGVRTGSFASMSKVLYFGSHVDNSGGISAIKSGSAVSGTVTNKAGISTRRTRTLFDGDYYVYVSTIDGDAYAKMYRQTGTWQSGMPLCMFGFYNGTDLNIASSARIMRVTILNKNSPIADYLPCLDNNGVACMWDNVAQKYVYNDGTGDFAYGDPITPTPLESILYVKKEGTWEVIV